MTAAELSLPRSWDEITPDWMTAALGNHFPGATVDGVTVALRDDGTNRRARLALTY
ncbi:MAG TPA: aminoglycoside phosphotransferase, partial [Mycobacterium sp.]|nr:aminoglycoside phosphotransferase [Mycobacterium sp.]